MRIRIIHRAAAFSILAGPALAMATPVAPLNPLAYASLGSISADVVSGYAFNTGDGTTAPTLTRQNSFDPNDKTVYTGVISNGVAVFDFDSIYLRSATATGSLPLALLSRSTVTIGGTITTSTPNLTTGQLGGGDGGGYTFGVGTTPGGGPGGGVNAQGGAYGNYGDTGSSQSAGRNFKIYGNYDDAFHAGSGGGTGIPNSFLSAGNGGAGGGAFHVSALGDITLTVADNNGNIGGKIIADGGDGIAAFGSNGGGGSGGGIFLATPGRVINNGLLSAAGGDAAASTLTFPQTAPGNDAGGGSGGRILVEAGNGYLAAGTGGGIASVLGGTSFNSGVTYAPINNGSFFVTGYVNPIPEPAALAAVGLAAVAGLKRRRA